MASICTRQSLQRSLSASFAGGKSEPATAGSLPTTSMRVIPIVTDDGTKVDLPEGWWIQPVRRGFMFKCCDCGLKHRMDFRVHKGRAQFRAWRMSHRKKK